MCLNAVKSVLIICLRMGVGLIAGLCISVSVASADDVQFSFVFACEYGKREICIHGKHPRSIPVVLLANEGNNTCLGKTGDFIQIGGGEVDEFGAFDATRITPTQKCRKPDRYFAAVIGEKVRSFANVNLLDAEPSIKNKVVHRIDKEKFIENILDNSVDPVTRYKREDISRKPESLRVYTIDKKKIYIASYIMGDWISGPVVAFIDGKLQSLADSCSRPQKAFRLNSKSYFISGAACCGCGWYGRTIFEFKNGKFESVYTNGDFSD